ncbi:MAG: hypothetical protein WC054_10900 [Candidatus Nanopelagicales bacterium]
MSTALGEAVSSRYLSRDYPAVNAQVAEWEQSRPLDGAHVLDATPLFGNTLAKFLPLITAGAKVSAGVHPDVPADPAIVALLPDLGIDIVVGARTDAKFDVVLDCAGRHRDVASTYGYAELTHSGLAHYAGTRQSVVMVDESPLKLLETMFGTGESFGRALDKLGALPTNNRGVVFGAGKVGSGIALNALDRGMLVTLIDRSDAANFARAPLVDLRDVDAVTVALAAAGVIVTATGVAGAVANFAEPIVTSNAVVANMGVDDEFGPDVPASRVLNGKAPVNFVLAEPTLMRYMDPIFALSNAAAVDLVNGEVQPGINPPNPSIESVIATHLRQAGSNLVELAFIERLRARSL